MYWLEHHAMTMMEITQPAKAVFHQKGLLLIDDDPWFRAVFRVVCEARGIPITTFASLADMPSVAALQDYDLVIVDYFLESFTGTEIAEYVDAFFKQVPVVIVSGGQIPSAVDRGWPASIRGFITKENGAHTILDFALQVITPIGAETDRIANVN
ncbi:MAG: hypothetical protein RL011_535 [Pseudomonadota bacterium]